MSQARMYKTTIWLNLVKMSIFTDRVDYKAHIEVGRLPGIGLEMNWSIKFWMWKIGAEVKYSISNLNLEYETFLRPYESESGAGTKLI